MAKASFWRRTPPALFPATLGMIGLGLAWRAAEGLGAPAGLGALILAAAGAVFAFIFCAYLAKIAARPAALKIDLNPPPGRAAVSAGSMCLMMLAAGWALVLGPAPVAVGAWFAGLALHVVYTTAVTSVVFTAPKDQRCVSPTLYLPYVGYIVAPIGGVALGFPQLSAVIFFASLVTFGVIALRTTPPLIFAPVPVGARAAAAIGLAPASVAGLAAHALEMPRVMTVFALAAILIAAILILRRRWLMAGGFTPAWGAFTFPSASFAGLMVAAALRWGGGWEWLAWAGLLAATLIAPPIWALTLRAWVKGKLAPATGAATA